LKGVVIGLFFPFLAIFVCIHFLTTSDYLFSLSALHVDFPLLWIIDSAPIVLGLMSYILGTKVNKSNLNFLSTYAILEGQVEEKNVLLKEVHHRVKNNLQIITSILRLQARFVKKNKHREIFKQGQYRINSMAMIHEMLYQSNLVSKININNYVEKLLSRLISSIKGSCSNIEVQIKIPDIVLNMDTAIPLGLLITEIITNSLKHGIQNNKAGNLNIEIQKIDLISYKMKIGDNGVGYSNILDLKNMKSLGFRFINKMIIQLNGRIIKNTDLKGTNYIIDFQDI